MTTKITRNIIEAFLNCKYEAHLKLTGQLGVQSDYQTLLVTLRDAVRRSAFDSISAGHAGGEDVQQGIALTPTALKLGAPFLLNATLEDHHVTLAFDGLKRVQGPSTLGDFHCVPVLFFESRQIRKQQRALLEVYGLLLSRLQGRMPAFGILWHGSECRQSSPYWSRPPKSRATPGRTSADESSGSATPAGTQRPLLNLRILPAMPSTGSRRRQYQSPARHEGEGDQGICPHGLSNRDTAGPYVSPAPQRQEGAVPRESSCPRATSCSCERQKSLHIWDAGQVVSIANPGARVDRVHDSYCRSAGSPDQTPARERIQPNRISKRAARARRFLSRVQSTALEVSSTDPSSSRSIAPQPES